ncbi:MAG: hypothetical protein QNI99_04370 [Woeseiaceae bacterium]|nr:hypothetical protein [Woeseiaceae bacterium]
MFDRRMRARMLMSVSAVLLALPGLAGSFLSEETLDFLGSDPDTVTIILVQITAALYMGFAILNWMARGSVLGGIYGRPVLLGNFLHFAVVATLLIKASVVHQTLGLTLVAALYAFLAGWFGLVLFTHPGSR